MKIRLILLCAVLIAGCGKFAQEFKDISRLGSDLAAQYHEIIGVNVMNGTVLTLTVPMPDDPKDKMSPEDRRALSLEIARFARTHYARADSLNQIAVIWVSRSQFGPVNVSRKEEGGRWTPGELAADSSAEPAR